MGAALRLVHGAVPYRDFVLLHPPGVPLLLVPFVSLGSLIGGSHVAFGLARIVTIVVSASNASLAAVAVRYRGIGAMLVAGTALACFPLAPAANQTVYLEPFLVFFCLIGVCVMFQNGSPAGPWRLALAGVAFGLAAACKVWGIIPIAVAIALCLPHWRSRVRPLALGVLVGVGVPCLPFFLAAPGAFHSPDRFGSAEPCCAGPLGPGKSTPARPHRYGRTDLLSRQHEPGFRFGHCSRRIRGCGLWAVRAHCQGCRLVPPRGHRRQPLGHVLNVIVRGSLLVLSGGVHRHGLRRLHGPNGRRGRPQTHRCHTLERRTRSLDPGACLGRVSGTPTGELCPDLSLKAPKTHR